MVGDRRAAHIVAVEEDGELVTGPLLDALDQPVGVHGHEDACRILEGQPVRPHLYQLLSVVHPPLEGVDRTDRVVHLDVGFSFGPARLYGINSDLQVSEVVSGLKYPEDVHAVGYGPLHEPIDSLV